MDFTKYKRLMDSLTEEYLPCTDSIIYDGYEPVFRYMTGCSDREAGIKMSGNEKFFCFSITKIFTCTAALQLFEEGKFLLTDHLCKYMPEYDPRITIKQLMTMTAGFDYDRSFAEGFKNTDMSTREVLKALAQRPMVYEPGTSFQYSLGHDVLGAFIEVISGEKLSEYINEHICRPLGMFDTYFNNGETDGIAALYKHNAEIHCAEVIPKDLEYALSRNYESGGAGLISTTEDLGKFCCVLSNGGTSKDGVRILSKATIDLMRTNFLDDHQKRVFNEHFPQYAGYGYGLGVRTFMDPTVNGESGPIGEFGWAGAAGAYVIIDPVNRLTLVFMTHVIESIDHEDTIKIKNAFYSCV